MKAHFVSYGVILLLICSCGPTPEAIEVKLDELTLYKPVEEITDVRLLDAFEVPAECDARNAYANVYVVKVLNEPDTVYVFEFCVPILEWATEGSRSDGARLLIVDEDIVEQHPHEALVSSNLYIKTGSKYLVGSLQYLLKPHRVRPDTIILPPEKINAYKRIKRRQVLDLRRS